MTLQEQTLGLVSARDVISLAPSLRLRRSRELFDAAAEARHMLRKDAYRAVGMLRQPLQAQDWQQRNGLTEFQTAELVRFLDSIAGLNVHRSRVAGVRLALLRVRLRAQGAHVVAPSVRYAGTYHAVTSAVLRATVPVAVVLLAVIGLGYGGGVFGRSFALAQVVLLVSVFVTTVLHEGVHLWFARRAGRPAVAIVRGVRVGVLHPTLPARQEILSAIAGPASGALLAGLICGLSAATEQPWFVTASAGMVALFHVCSWLPEYGDGITIKQYIRGWHAKKT